MSDSPAVVLYDASGVAMAVSDGVAIPVGVKGVVLVGSDGTNLRFVRTATDGTVRTDPTGTTTQPISAAALPLPAGAATQTTLAALLTELQLKADLSETQPVSAASLPLPVGAATEATLALIKAKTDNLDVALSTRAITGLTDAQLRAAAVPISAASLPLPAGAATEATLATRATETKLEAVRALLASLDGKDFSTQTTLAALLSAFNAEDFATQATLALVKAKTDNLDVALSTRSSEATLSSLNSKDFATQTTLAALLTAFNAEDFATQTTLAALLTAFNAEDFATQTTLAALLTAFNAEDFASETTLLTRLTTAAFEARINTLGQKAMAASTPIVIASDQSEVASKNALGSQVDGHSVAIGATTDADTALTVIGRLKQIITKLAAGLPAALVAGRLDTNTGSWLGSTAPTVGQKAMAASVPVVLASDQSTVIVAEQKSATATHTSVAGSVTSVTLLASNASRRGATVYNDSNANLFVKFAATASSTSFMVKLDANGYLEVPFGYTGIIDGIWNVANGDARVVEFT